MRYAILAIMLLAAPAAMAQSFGSRSHFTEQGGAAVYAGICAGCHMPDGRGAVGAGAYPSLAQNPRLQGAAYPIAMVLAGHKDMPSFAHTLTDQQIADVVAYIRTHFGNAATDTPTAADVKAARP